MCNSSNPPLLLSVTEKPAWPPPTHLFLDLFLSLSTAKQESLGPGEATTFYFAAEAKSLFALALPITLTTLILYSRSSCPCSSSAVRHRLHQYHGLLHALRPGPRHGAPLFSCLQGLRARSCSPSPSTAPSSSSSPGPSPSLSSGSTCIGSSSTCVRTPTSPALPTPISSSLPKLLTNSFLHPIRIYLRAQGITHPSRWLLSSARSFTSPSTSSSSVASVSASPPGRPPGTHSPSSCSWFTCGRHGYASQHGGALAGTALSGGSLCSASALRVVSQFALNGGDFRF